MPPKSRISSKSEYSQCNVCSCIIGFRDLKKHLGVCGPAGAAAGNLHVPRVSTSSSEDVDKTEECDDFSHGFVRSRILYAVVDVGVTELDVHLPKSFPKHRLVSLSTAAMRACDIYIGGPVIINDQQVCYSWPSNNIPFATARISQGLQQELCLQPGNILKVKALTGPKILAGTLALYPVDFKPFMSSEQFTNYFHSIFNGFYYAPGSVISGKYLGQPYQLIVTEISGCDGSSIHIDSDILSTQIKAAKENCNETTSLHSITADLSVLSLNESKSEKSGDAPLSSTPKPRGRNASSGGKLSDGEKSFIKQNLSLNLDESVEKYYTSPSVERTEFESDACTKQFYVLESSTRIDIVTQWSSADGKRDKDSSKIACDIIGGLDQELDAVREVICLPLEKPSLFESHGLPLPKGVLLYGATGTGKTLLTRTLANEVKAHVITVNGPEIWSKFYGESEAKLRAIFDEASQRAPSLIIIDEIDAMCPKRESVQSEAEKRVVATLLTLMDGLDMSRSQGHVIVLAATNKPDSLDPALRRPGRFDHEVEIPVPSAKQRAQILKKLLQPLKTDLTDEDIVEMAETTHGFVGADLAAVCREAGLHAVKSQAGHTTEELLIQREDFQYALKAVQPSAMREVAIDVPKVLWSDIGGQGNLKLKLKQAVEWPLKHPEAFERMGIQAPKGLLMYGPPGCSKTMIAKALATESGLNFIAIKGPELFSKWVGESERAVREVFRKAKSAAPSIVFFDEIDALAVERGSGSGSHNVADRVLAQLLTEMDGVENLKDVTIIAATNRPDMIDKALMRPGRIDRIVYVPIPDAETRREIFNIRFQRMPIDGEVDISELVEKTQGYSGAEVTAVCHEAALFALQENIEAKTVSRANFLQALEAVTPRTSPDMLKFYQDYQSKFGMKSV